MQNQQSFKIPFEYKVSRKKYKGHTQRIQGINKLKEDYLKK